MSTPLNEALIDAINEAAGQPGPKLRDRLVKPSQCGQTKRRGYIVKGVLAPGDAAAMVAHPGAGKSVAAPYIGYGIAQGRRVFGLRTKAGKVFYAAAEDIAGMRQRVDALFQRYGDTDNFNLFDISDLNDPANADELFKLVQDEKPSVLIIDTIGAAWAGIEENGSKGEGGMGGVVAFARRITKTGTAVLLIHHPAKNGDGSPRGHSSLNGTLDACLVLDRKPNESVIKIRMTKNRNGSPFLPMAFKIESFSLGKDEDGDQITAPIAVEVTETAQEPATPTWEDDLSPLRRTLVAALRETIDKLGSLQPSGVRACAVDDWRQVFYGMRPALSKDTNKRVFNQALKELPEVSGRVIVIKDGWAWIDEKKPAQEQFEPIMAGGSPLEGLFETEDA